MKFTDIPPICQGTEHHFECHDYIDGKGPVIIYWLHPELPRFWSHDSDYPWRLDELKQSEREHIARYQIVALQRLNTNNISEKAKQWLEMTISAWQDWELMRSL